MAFSRFGYPGNRLAFLLALVSTYAGSLGLADSNNSNITILAQSQVPEWLLQQPMGMSLVVSNSSHRETLMPTFEIFRLTAASGLNQSTERQNTIQIRGTLTAVTQSNYKTLNTDSDIAYLSCDDDSDRAIDNNELFNNLLNNQNLGAILLYSLHDSWCAISGAPPSLSSAQIVSMGKRSEADIVLKYLNGTYPDAEVGANIANSTHMIAPGSAKSPAIATSILYGVTGVIALLFVGIIVAGAFRVRGNPARYGPRPSVNGRPRQSRARGIARAFLDTIPVVKFGDNATNPKPDPEVELENATGTRDETARGEEQPAGVTAQPKPSAQSGETHGIQSAPGIGETTASKEQKVEKYTECSICTENFTVGDDVRVLPCDHQFHPDCIDPWLVQVSGTCPLCRLDLRGGQKPADDEAATQTGSGDLPPPIAVEAEELNNSSPAAAGSPAPAIASGEIGRATREERLAVVRRLLSHGNASVSQTAARESRPNNRFTERLRERFRVRTRAQPPAQ